MVAQISFLFFLSAVSLKSNECANPSSVSTIPLPAGYERIPVQTNSFGAYLRSIRLKPDKTVYLFNGQRKANQSAQYAVLDISKGNRDLQQCADAVMRLRAEYLKQQNSPVCFTDNAGKSYCWSNYKQRGWQSYLETVFGMCGTLSLQKQLKAQSWDQITPGDVIIKGGSPGHAVIVMDIARHRITGNLIFLLAQSYMPAQDVHVLLNTNEAKLNPWYSIPNDFLKTPEWTFTSSQLRTWP
jgi:Domain of unknown function (4846)